MPDADVIGQRLGSWVERHGQRVAYLVIVGVFGSIVLGLFGLGVLTGWLIWGWR